MKVTKLTTRQSFTFSFSSFKINILNVQLKTGVYIEPTVDTVMQWLTLMNKYAREYGFKTISWYCIKSIEWTPRTYNEKSIEDPETFTVYLSFDEGETVKYLTFDNGIPTLTNFLPPEIWKNLVKYLNEKFGYNTVRPSEVSITKDGYSLKINESLIKISKKEGEIHE